MTTQSFSVGGFWYHVRLISANVYKDHQNNLWILKNNRFYSECGGLVSGPVEQPRQKGWTSADDLFLQQRESYHEFFNTRYYNNR